MNRNRGMSLVEMLVAIAILSVIAAAFTSFMVSQQRETQALNERLASMDSSRNISDTLSRPISCNLLFAATNIVGGAAPLTFNATSVSPTAPYVIDFINVAGLTNGAVVSANSQSLKVLPANGLQLLVESPTFARLRIFFDQNKLIRPIKDLSFPLNIASSGPLNNTTILGCTNTASPTKILSATNVGTPPTAAYCSTAGWAAGFCPGYYSLPIVFSTPFTSIPNVIVAADEATDPVLCPCCAGTTDHITAKAANITTTGFDLVTGSSPTPGSCTPAQDNQYVPVKASWIAVGF